MIKNQKGAIAPLLVITLLVVGIFVGMKLIENPQILRSKAAAPAPVPSNLRVECISDTQAKLRWDPAKGANLYKVRLDNLRHGWDGSCGKNAATDGDACRDVTLDEFQIGVVKDQEYQFWVHSSNSNGESARSDYYQFKCPAAIPTSPTNLAVECISDTQAKLKWNTSSGATNYKVRLDNMKHGWDGGCGTNSATDGDTCRDSSKNEYQIGVVKDQPYQFWVNASNSAGDSSASVHYQFKCPGGAIGNTPTLTSLTVSPADGETISNTDTISVTATVINGDKFDVWVDKKCFWTTSLSGQTTEFTIAQVVDAGRPNTTQCTPDTKNAGSYAIHVFPIRGTTPSVTSGQDQKATYTLE